MNGITSMRQTMLSVSKKQSHLPKASANSGRIWRILRNICFWILLAVFVLQIVLTVYLHRNPEDLVKRMPVRMLEITSDSMYPVLRAGDGVLEISKEFSELQTGDMITFLQSGDMVTHEIISVNEDGTVTTEGLANGIPDAPVTRSRYVGKVVCRIPNLSVFLSLTYGPARKLIWVALFVVLLFGPEIFSRIYDLFYERGRR